MELVLTFLLLAFLGATALGVAKTRNLFSAVVLAGIFSFLSAGLFTVMDAVDVAFTEAAVGAGVSTVFYLATLALVGGKVRAPEIRITTVKEKQTARTPRFPLVVVVVTGAILIYGTLDMPPYGEPNNPIHRHVTPRYLEETDEEIGVPNVVTAVLASYRGYDTLGETTVVFTAAVGVMMLLSRLKKRDELGEEPWGEEPVESLDVGFGALEPSLESGDRLAEGEGRAEEPAT